jgi:hypothetical protein
MRREPYASRNLLFYPGLSLSEDEKRRMDALEVPIEELTTDHLVYSMGRQIEANFQSFYTVAEEIVGEGAALEIAREIGRRYGGGGYAKLLAAYGTPGEGTARMMALYQDIAHAIRGPKHTSALYAEYDDDRCVVERDHCIYYDESRPENGKYTGAFEEGCFEGYVAADRNLDRVEVHRCRWRGDDGCRISWEYSRQETSRSNGEPQGAE